MVQFDCIFVCTLHGCTHSQKAMQLAKLMCTPNASRALQTSAREFVAIPLVKQRDFKRLDLATKTKNQGSMEYAKFPIVIGRELTGNYTFVGGFSELQTLAFGKTNLKRPPSLSVLPPMVSTGPTTQSQQDAIFARQAAAVPPVAVPPVAVPPAAVPPAAVPPAAACRGKMPSFGKRFSFGCCNRVCGQMRRIKNWVY